MFPGRQTFVQTSVVLSVKRWISKLQSLLERVKMCWKTEDFSGPGGFF